MTPNLMSPGYTNTLAMARPSVGQMGGQLPVKPGGGNGGMGSSIGTMTNNNPMQGSQWGGGPATGGQLPQKPQGGNPGGVNTMSGFNPQMNNPMNPNMSMAIPPANVSRTTTPPLGSQGPQAPWAANMAATGRPF